MATEIKGFFWKEFDNFTALVEENTEKVRYIIVPVQNVKGLTEVKMFDGKLIGIFLSEGKAMEFCESLIETQTAQVERSK